MEENRINPDLYKDVSRLGAKDMEACMQCGNCAASCPLSEGSNTFPRKIYRYLQLGLTDKLLESPEPWLCYYCGDCNTDCPRGAEPAETMMATRRWLTTQYDWTGLASRFYASPKWLVGAVLLITFFVIGLYLALHGPVVTDKVELNTFAPAHWVHLGDEIMILIVMGLLLSNGFNMYRKIMQGTKIPLKLYLTEAPVFVLNYFTQKKWRKCGTGPSSAWWRHLFLFSGWVAMEVLIMIFLTSFQTDIIHPFWHPTRIVGYYATVALLLGSGTMLYSRWFKKEANLHRYSDFTDILFLVLIFVIAISGILVHIFRLAGFPLTTYTIYVVHVGICVAMLMIMLPFGKLAHLLYRPLAIFLITLKQKAQKQSLSTLESVKETIGDTFQTCMQCGTCTASCPKGRVSSFSPRQILRNISLERATNVTADLASWDCTTCNSCVEHCPRGIPISDLMRSIREQTTDTPLMPPAISTAIHSLKKNSNPWGEKAGDRHTWHKDMEIPAFSTEHEFCLFTCCTTTYAIKDSNNYTSGKALITLLKNANISFGSLGSQERCCGDLATNSGQVQLAREINRDNNGILQAAGVKKVLTSSPHCLNSIKKSCENFSDDIETSHYTELLSSQVKSGKLRPSIEVSKKVTFHDPCYLGRYNEIYEAPRHILNSIPGLTFLEMQNNKTRSLCCGGGGGGIFKDDISTKGNAALRIKEAIATGAETLVTACPYCQQIFSETIDKLQVKDKIHVQDLSELLLQSINLDSEKLHHMSTDQEEIHV